MEALYALLFIIVGFFLLIKGADLLVDGGSDIARRYGISDLVIGLTIVSFGTSAPELIVNVVASFKGSADIAIGNIIGSNISNTLLILGATATITPLAVQRSTVFKEIPFSLLAVVMLFIMANDSIINGYGFSELSRSDGLCFMGFFIIFLYYIFSIRKGKPHPHEHHTAATHSTVASGALIVGGLIGLGAGGELAVRGAIQIATIMNWSEKLIGLTIVALGTSLPELTASIVAALKNKPDISVGNIIGSNIFNIFWILGLSSLIRPIPFEEALNPDLVIVVFSTFALFIFIHTGKIHHRLFRWWRQYEGHELTRPEGLIMLVSYIVYIVFIGLRG